MYKIDIKCPFSLILCDSIHFADRNIMEQYISSNKPNKWILVDTRYTIQINSQRTESIMHERKQKEIVALCKRGHFNEIKNSAPINIKLDENKEKKSFNGFSFFVCGSFKRLLHTFSDNKSKCQSSFHISSFLACTTTLCLMHAYHK